MRELYFWAFAQKVRSGEIDRSLQHRFGLEMLETCSGVKILFLKTK